MDRNIAHRILDANFNRTQEALRTLEDIARFNGLRSLQLSYKQIRHELTKVASCWDQRRMLLARDAHNDPGRTQKTDSELQRSRGLVDVLSAASQRVQQSLRSIEETSKYLYPESAGPIEAFRYRLYDINRQFQLSLSRDITFLMQSQLYVLVDCRFTLDEFCDRISEISRAGVQIIQVRDKTKDARDLIRFTRAAIDHVDFSQTRIIVNDRADVAACSLAWGVHVGQTDLSVSQARNLLPSGGVVGLSTHDLDQVREAVTMDADYIGCGPTFPSETKTFSAFSGLSFLEQASAYLKDNDRVPAFAIGGIRDSNLDQVLSAGFYRIAVSNVIWNSPTPGRIASQLRDQLSSAMPSKDSG